MRQEGHRQIDCCLGVTLSHTGLSTCLKSLTNPGTNLLLAEAHQLIQVSKGIGLRAKPFPTLRETDFLDSSMICSHFWHQCEWGQVEAGIA